jgi:hypothetical protein
MKFKVTLPSLFAARLRKLMWTFFLLLWSRVCEGQQIQWLTVLPLEKTDWVQTIVKDTSGYLYCGGETQRNRVTNSSGNYINRTLFIKLDEHGDTVFIRNLGIPGRIYGMTFDPYGMIRAVIKEQYAYSTLYVSISPDGFVFQKDSIQRTEPKACMMGKDSSFVFVGYMDRPGFPADRSMYFQRIQKYGFVDPIVELNPGHPNCVANRVEQLPNGHYLVSGYVGSRIASYELNEDGSNPEFKLWYQTPDLSNMTSGYVGKVGTKSSFIGGDGGPCLVANYDSLSNKKWMHKEVGVLYPPQGMTDGGVVYGFNPNLPPYNVFYKRAPDSTTTWYMNIDDSLQTRGIVGSIEVKAYTYFEDQSAIFAGTIYQGSFLNQRDPFFMKVANVGTPVTSLTKPKRGTLSNETLAPWPNPSGGTLYLKQHFDKAEVHFYTVSGREIQTDTVRFGQPIDISSFAPGLYLYRAVIDGKPFSGKVMRD